MNYTELPTLEEWSYLKHGEHYMGGELPSGADGDSPGELLRRDGLVCQSVHSHRDLEVVQVVQEQAEVLELVERDALQADFGQVWNSGEIVLINLIF